MRKVTELAVTSFLTSNNFRQSNTKVVNDDNGTSMYLHGNKIANYKNGKLTISSCGWKTNTTKERLNGLLKSYNLPLISQKNFVWYIGNDLFKDGLVLNC